MPNFKLHILDVSKHAMTGRITLEAQVIELGEANTVHGAVEGWCIEALEISTKYNGRFESWLEYVGREMLQRHRLRTAAHSNADQWHGKHMDIIG